MKKVFLFIFLMIMFCFEVNAEACDAYDIKRLKELANSVEITYELQEPLILEEGEIKDVYKINISGLTNELAVLDYDNMIRYTVDTDFNDYIYYGGKRSFKIASVKCANVLKTVDLKLPVYNNYSDSGFCSGLKNENLYVCQTWTEEMITESEFFAAVNKAEQKKHDFFNFDKNKMYILCLICLFIFAFIIIFVSLKKRRGRLV